MFKYYVRAVEMILNWNEIGKYFLALLGTLLLAPFSQSAKKYLETFFHFHFM